MTDASLTRSNTSGLSGIWLQTGFAEGVITEGLTFNSLQAAFAHIFNRNRESVILLCNGIPVCFSYRSDLPVIVPEILRCLDVLQQHKNLQAYELFINTHDIETAWVFDLHDDIVSVAMRWFRVKGDYQAALNVFGVARYEKHVFVNEWLMLLKQCQQCLIDAGVVLTGDALAGRNLLNRVEARIQSFGRFYQRLNTGSRARCI